MNNVTIGEFLKVAYSDDCFYVNIRSEDEKFYLGYSHKVPEEILGKKIKSIYIDWASEALGIDVFS